VLATFTTAAKEELLSSFVPWSADECICAFESQGKKVHQGVAPQNLALHQGIAWSNSTTALGLRGAQLETRVRSRCTGKEWDAESGLDMFGARYYSSSSGRFMTPDWAAKPTSVPYADFGNPQSLNLYSYVHNNPTATRDLDGHGDSGTFCNTACRYGTPVSDRELQIDVGVLELESAAATGGAGYAAASAGLVMPQVLGGITAAGLFVNGTTRIVLAPTGVPAEDIERGTRAVSTTTDLVGFTSTVLSNGNIKMGDAVTHVVAVAKIVKNPSEAAKDPAGVGLAIKDITQDASQAFNAIRNFFNPPPPPPPPLPPPPFAPRAGTEDN
jgi:RHS repeat-associated protein